jgi:integrase
MCRPDPALDLTVGQLHFDDGPINLNPEGRVQTKKHRPWVPMTQFLRSEVKDIERKYVIQYHGEKIDRIKTAWRELRTEAGLDKSVNPYSIRHTISRELRRWRAAPAGSARPAGRSSSTSPACRRVRAHRR